MKIDTEQCNRDVRTYGDVIRHMTNGELALFLEEMGANVEMSMLAAMRAKILFIREDSEEPRAEQGKIEPFYRFMEHRINEEEPDYADIWEIENWQDLMQWESKYKKNFGMDVIY